MFVILTKINLQKKSNDTCLVRKVHLKKKKRQTCTCFNFSNVNIWWFSLSCVIVSWRYLGFWLLVAQKSYANISSWALRNYKGPFSLFRHTHSVPAETFRWVTGQQRWVYKHEKWVNSALFSDKAKCCKALRLARCWKQIRFEQQLLIVNRG